MVQNKPIFNFLTSIISDYRSFSLKVPEFVDNIELQKEFIKAIFDDEGTVALRVFKKTREIKRNVTIASKSKKLLEDIKKIMQDSFGIYSNRIIKYTKICADKRFTTYYLSITGKENFVKFRDLINFDHPNKKLKLNVLIGSYIRK
jgi:hypothetical protein